MTIVLLRSSLHEAFAPRGSRLLDCFQNQASLATKQPRLNLMVGHVASRPMARLGSRAMRGDLMSKSQP